MRAGTILAPILLGALLAGAFGGPAGLMGVGLGAGLTVSMAVVTIDLRIFAALAAMTGAAAWLGALAAAHPVAVAALVAMAALVTAPLSRLSAGLPTMIPVAAGIGASVIDPHEGASVAIWLLLGAALVRAVAGRVSIALPPQPLTGVVAWRHGLVVALAAGLAAWAVTQPPLTVLAALACLPLAIAWALPRDARRQYLFLTPAIVLLSSGGATAPAVNAATDRLALTLAGVAVAGVGAVALARWDTR